MIFNKSADVTICAAEVDSVVGWKVVMSDKSSIPGVIVDSAEVTWSCAETACPSGRITTRLKKDFVSATLAWRFSAGTVLQTLIRS